MATDAQTLVNDAKCISCIPIGDRLPILIALAAQMAGVSADPEALVAGARCYECIPPGYRLPVLISLADQIANGTSEWILATGFWNDSGIWTYTAVWID